MSQRSSRFGSSEGFGRGSRRNRMQANLEAQKRRRRAPIVESLENRRLLSTLTINADDTLDYNAGAAVANDVSVSWDSGTFTWTIADSAETITVTDNSGGGFVIGGDGTNTVTIFQDTASLDSLTFNTDDDDDTVAVNSNSSTSSIQVNLGAGDDTLILADGVNLVEAGTGTGAVDGGTGTIDTIDYSAWTTAINVNLAAGTATNTGGVSNINGVFGGAGSDTITGAATDDLLVGGPGDDSIDGGSGNDFITDDLGSNTLVGGDGDDSILGGDNDDTITGDAGNDTIIAGIGNDSVDGGIGADSILGGLDNDTIDGGDGDDTIDGGDGDDSLVGGHGNDTVSGGNDNDTLVWNPGDGSDQMNGDDGIDTVVVNGSVGVNNFGIAVSGVDPARQTFDGDTTGAGFQLDIGTVEGLDVNLLLGDDNFLVDNTNGLVSYSNGINLDAGLGSDSLTVSGDPGDVTGAVYLPGPTADAGTVTATNGTVTETINFIGLEPVDFLTPSPRLVINVGAGDDTVNIVDNVTTYQVNFGGAFELINFLNQDALVLNTGVGNDTITVDLPTQLGDSLASIDITPAPATTSLRS